MTIDNSNSLEYPADRRRISPVHQFHGWRLLAGIMLVVTFLAVASATIDWMIIGPLEGRIL